ncbi:MAG: hypothetical protein QOD87_499 [Pseudonocardiales bacterium]|nr:hypothetical protein [Pseudonocardiales bacterium]
MPVRAAQGALSVDGVLTLPWPSFAPDSPDRACTVLAARLPLRSLRSVPAALTWTWRLHGELSTTPGVAGHAAALELTDLALWTVSAWTSRTDLTRFDRSDLHQTARSVLRPQLWPATFAVWTCAHAALPVSWAEVRARIESASHC